MSSAVAVFGLGKYQKSNIGTKKKENFIVISMKITTAPKNCR